MRLLIKSERDREKYIEFIKGVDVTKKLYVATFTVKRKERSLKQNKLLWRWIRLIHDETGNDEKTLYNYFCEQHLPWNTEICFSREMIKTGGSSQLSTVEFNTFLEDIKVEMAEEGIYLPYPDELGWDEFEVKYGDVECCS